MLVCEEKDGEDERIESGILSNVGGILLLYRKQNQNQMHGKTEIGRMKISVKLVYFTICP